MPLTSLEERFRIHASNICALVEEEGIVIRPHARHGLPFFNLLNDDEKLQVIRDLQQYYQICLDVKMNGRSLRDTKFFTLKALERHGFAVDPDLLDKIESNHLVEFYNFLQTQIFRTLLFFEVGSYTLEDLYCRKWYNLYERTPADQAAIEKTAAELFAQKKTIRVNNPEHVIKERDSLERLSIRNKLLWASPLKKEGVDVAVILIATASLA
ncbi:hypothetical protein QJS83_05620 [Bdellovibrio sp. 22V]|uniref:hypothetical protein n=1 Tax=Bdellovibrio sp. 22V TaxID=3044166 RepID=UPI0025435CC3|nr:hypothetical protein [Bdellovibrio sp. 22V]WII73347.1 hypothetical protein QJS83_05620 [Bdellovibrio sp. 22V]